MYLGVITVSLSFMRGRLTLELDR